MGALVYFNHQFIYEKYNHLVLSAQELDIIKIPAKENNNTEKTKTKTKIEITKENNDIKITKIPKSTLNNKTTKSLNKEKIIPPKREKLSLIQHTIKYIEDLNIWIVVLVIGLMGFVILGSLFIHKNRKKSEEKDAYILSEANKISKTPRQAKMIYNQVKAIALIGKKDFYFQHTLFTLLRDGSLNFIFKSSIYLYIIIPYLLEHIKLYKFNEYKIFKKYHNRLCSILLGSSKTKQGSKNFEREILYIMSYIQGKKDGDLFYLKDKLSIIDVKKYNANRKTSIILK
jgi:hypothetical protein